MEATTAVIWLTLVSMAGPTSDNVTETGLDYSASISTGKSPPSSSPSSSYYRSSYYVSPTFSLVCYIATVIIAVVGILANAYVLLALLFSKNSRASNVNAFITHQTIMDLTSCIFLLIGLVLDEVSIMKNESLARFLCLFFGSHSITTTAGIASTCGLMIITIERYVKIVHPVAYRNHYRRWMTRAGIIFPWIYGACISLIPLWITSSVVRGVCVKGRVGSNAAEKLSWSVATFLLRYLGPLAVFVFGYWKILGVIRRQRKQVGQNQAQGTSDAATAAAKTGKRTETNVIRTMVLVSVTFALSFVCMRTYSILTALKAVPGIGALYLLFSVFSYSSRCLNPFIYATQYEVVRRWWRVVVCRVVRHQHVVEASMTRSAAPDTGEKPETTKSHMTTKNL